MQYQDLFPLPAGRLAGVDLALVDGVHRWAEQEVIARRHANREREDYDRLLAPAIRKLFVDIGLQNMFWNESAGGSGVDSPAIALTWCALLEQIGRADTGIAFLAANTTALQTTFTLPPHRNSALMSELEGVFCRCEEPALGALVLPRYVSVGQDEHGDLFGLGYQASVSRGRKHWLVRSDLVRPTCAGRTARLLGVVFQVGPDQPALLLVDRTDPGVVACEPIEETGLAASRNGLLSFKDVRSPHSRLVFASLAEFRALLNWYYLGCAACSLGATLSAWEILKDWGETRVIKGRGQVFKNNPLVASLMGSIGGRIGVCRLLTYELAAMLSHPEVREPHNSPALFATATAVVRHVTDTSMTVLDNTMELMGSAGYATEWNLERTWRDLKSIQTHLGPLTASHIDMARHYFGCRTI